MTAGTTVHAAQKTGRQWIGIDVTYRRSGALGQHALPTASIPARRATSTRLASQPGRAFWAGFWCLAGKTA
jgi:hypothetical protein